MKRWATVELRQLGARQTGVCIAAIDNTDVTPMSVSVESQNAGAGVGVPAGAERSFASVARRRRFKCA
jgi:hypothetical protein